MFIIILRNNPIKDKYENRDDMKLGSEPTKRGNIETGFIYHSMLMLIVFSMEIQNTINRLYPASTFGPTTVMTGNVTKTILDFFSYNSTQHTFEKLIDLKKSLVLLSWFFTGCILGALISSTFGLVSMLIPAALIISFVIFEKLISSCYSETSL